MPATAILYAIHHRPYNTDEEASVKHIAIPAEGTQGDLIKVAADLAASFNLREIIALECLGHVTIHDGVKHSLDEAIRKVQS